MADIMMCDSSDCVLRGACKRNEASGTKPHPTYQNYWMRYASSPRDHDCHNYWPLVQKKGSNHVNK